MQGFFDGAHLSGLHRLHGQQAIDKKAVAACGRNAPGGSVRTGDESGFFKIGHHVADGCGRQVESGKLR